MLWQLEQKGSPSRAQGRSPIVPSLESGRAVSDQTRRKTTSLAISGGLASRPIAPGTLLLTGGEEALKQGIDAFFGR
jgi:hypothetical protein